MQLDHINIRAPGELLEEVKDFYCGLFGLEDGFRPDFGQGGYWLYSEDRPVVHLSEDLLRPVGELQTVDSIHGAPAGDGDSLRPRVRLALQRIQYRFNPIQRLQR